MNAFKNRSVFDLTHEVKLSCDMGKLVPFYRQEVLPGDTIKCKTDILVRISPMLAPVMHRMNVFTHYFWVPTRIVHGNWPNFITGGKEGTDTTVIPTVKSPASTGYAAGTLWDYMGCPTGVPDLEVLAYPFRAYQLIYNEWYRDQNLIDPVAISTGDGLDSTTSMDLRSRCWEKDYFTSCLPWPQRGPAVTLSIGDSVPVVLDSTTGVDQLVRKTSDHSLALNTNALHGAATTGALEQSGGVTSVIDPNGTLSADLSEAAPISINDMRAAFQLQKWMENNARGGVRYVESILAHFGVRSSDARLQRPEFLGGGRSAIVVSEVLQTSSTDETSPQGNMAGHGYSAQSSHEFTKSFEEHGYVIGIMSIMPRTAYQQGVERMFNRRSKLDFAWPEFAHLGEQSVLNKEIYAAHSTPDGVFGYAPRYEEYRKMPSRVCGDFRTTLNYWHMGRIFDTAPALNSAFVTSDPTKRINAVTTEHNCWVQLLNSVKAVRPLPKRGVPGLIDH